MKQLWAPWRLAFVEKVSRLSGCIFCEKPALKRDDKSFILRRSRHAYVIMNIYPYNNGHLMVIPYKHVEELEGLPDATLSEMMVVTKDCCEVLKEAMIPHGFNIGVNVGDAAGAGIKEHRRYQGCRPRQGRQAFC